MLVRKKLTIHGDIRNIIIGTTQNIILIQLLLLITKFLVEAANVLEIPPENILLKTYDLYSRYSVSPISYHIFIEYSCTQRLHDMVDTLYIYPQLLIRQENVNNTCPWVKTRVGTYQVAENFPSHILLIRLIGTYLGMQISVHMQSYLHLSFHLNELID